MEAAIELETSPDLRPWAWYTGAHQQYHYGLLLLLEIFAFPMRKEADRIWACLDYIFEVPPHLPRDQKGRLILTEIRDKTMIYRNARKLRAPTGLVDRLGQQPARKPGTPLDTRPSVGKLQGFDPSTVEFSQDHVAGDALYSQNVDVNKLQGNTEPRYLPSNVPLPTPDDRVVDIDWVSVVLIRFGSNLILSVTSTSGTSYFHPTRTLRTSISPHILEFPKAAHRAFNRLGFFCFSRFVLQFFPIPVPCESQFCFALPHTHLIHK